MMRVDLNALVLVPSLTTRCGLGPLGGVGLAVCPLLGLLATSDMINNTVSVYSLPSRVGSISGTGTGLPLVCTLGAAASRAPMQFKFRDASGSYGGCMTFTDPATSRLLLLTDAGHGAVHVIDVAGRVHVGYVAAPGTIAGPRGVAARGSLAAVSTWASHMWGLRWGLIGETTRSGCSRAAGPAGLRCVFWLEASGSLVVQIGS
jgi:hypothetical protein